MQHLKPDLAFFSIVSVVFLILTGVTACNSSESLGQQSPSFDVFSQQFPKLPLPYSYTADSLMAAMSDSSRIKNPGNIHFVPDSVFFPNGDTSAAAYMIGKGKSEKYGKLWLFIKTITSGSKRVYALIYNKSDTLIAVKKVAARDKRTKDKTLTFKWTQNHILNVYEKTELGNGFVSYKRNAYSLLGGDHLQLILTNNNSPKQEGNRG